MKNLQSSTNPPQQSWDFAYI